MIKQCPKCGFTLNLEQFDNDFWYMCPNNHCDYIEEMVYEPDWDLEYELNEELKA